MIYQENDGLKTQSFDYFFFSKTVYKVLWHTKHDQVTNDCIRTNSQVKHARDQKRKDKV